MALLYSTLLYYGSTSLYLTLHYHGTTSFYLTLHYKSTHVPLPFTWLYITLPWFYTSFYLTLYYSAMVLYFILLDSILLCHGCTSPYTWLPCLLAWLYFTLLDSTTIDHNSLLLSFTLHNSAASTSLYLTLHHSTMVLLYSTWLYIHYSTIAVLNQLDSVMALVHSSLYNTLLWL